MKKQKKSLMEIVIRELVKDALKTTIKTSTKELYNIIANKYKSTHAYVTNVHISRIIKWLLVECECKQLMNQCGNIDDIRTTDIPLGTFFAKYKDHIIITKIEEIDTDSNSMQHRKLIMTIIGKNCSEIVEEVNSYRPSFVEENDNLVEVYTYNHTKDNISPISKIVDCKNINEIFLDDINVIIDFIDTFNNNTEFYTEKHIVHKTGILLHGEPGTGKSSLIKAIAKYMNRQLIIVNDPFKLKDLDGIKNSIVVFEDIDRYLDKKTAKLSKETEEVETETNNIGNLLNIMDGILSPKEVIFIATTNHIEKLDEALLRSGRFDLIHEVKPLHNKEIAERMCREYGQNPNDVLPQLQYPYNQSRLQQKLLEMRK